MSAEGANAAARDTVPPVLNLVGVTKILGQTAVVRDLHLSIAPGAFVTLLGPSGCGKSTTLNLIAGLLEPDEGRIYLRGDLVNGWEPRRRRLGMVFQSWALFPHMTVYENVAFGLRMQRVPDHEIRRRVTKMLALVRLAGIEPRYPSQLSGGMQQRIALARALATEPDVLLLDEPLSNLDERLRKEMQIELKRIHQQLRVTTLFVTHSQEEALVLSDWVAVMNQGVIVRVDTPERLYADPRSRFVCTFLGEANIFEGRVAAVEPGRFILDTGSLRIVACSRNRIGIGQSVAVAVRPEAISVRGETREAPGAENSLSATVRDIVYKGEAVSYYLDLPGATLVALEYPKESGRPGRGDRVYAEFRASASSVLEEA
jgi:ABC-type Fe3+/spermidine/putrescine transport system ATPase subunit